MLVKDAKKKVLPELTDEWVSEVTESETVDALRDDIRDGASSWSASSRRRWRMRDRVLEELSGLVPVEPPEPLVRQEMERRLHDLVHRLEAQGMRHPAVARGHGPGPGRVRSTGSGREPTKAVLADLALRAVVAQEEIEATDEELDAEIDRLAERTGEKPAEGAAGSRPAGGAGGGTL